MNFLLACDNFINHNHAVQVPAWEVNIAGSSGQSYDLPYSRWL